MDLDSKLLTLPALLMLLLAPLGYASDWGGPRRPPPVTDSDYYDNGAPDTNKVELGRLLFFDKILSGNRNISCASCHHPLAGTADGLSLSVGEGAGGLSVTRDTGQRRDKIVERVPRNAPAVFNLGAREFTRMFHDGRVEVHAGDPWYPSGIRSPAGFQLPDNLDNVLAAQAMFPVTSGTEMGGQDKENGIARAIAEGDLPKVWKRLARRLRRIQEYVALFKAAFPSEVHHKGDITYALAANAIAAFEAAAWRADDSPFDRYLRGEPEAMSAAAINGMRLFYGEAGCHGCHGGKFQTDHLFHAIGMPPVGPGKGDGYHGHDDFGREQVTADPADRYTFRTPSLRNVALTGPWGHDGACNSLEVVIRQHLDNPRNVLEAYDEGQVVLPSRPDLDALDFVVLEDPSSREAIIEAAAAEPLRRYMVLSDEQLSDLIAFLHALTDPASMDLREDVPAQVPSGLRMWD